MKTKILIFISVSVLLFGACQPKEVSKTTKPTSSQGSQAYLLAATLWQQSSAEAAALSYQNFHLARLMLDENMKHTKTDKPIAIITDLDETVIDNSAFNARMIIDNAPYSSESWAKWVKEAKAELLPGALDFFNYADSKGVHIVYLSNRSDSLKAFTMENLKRLGLPQISDKNILLKTDSSDKTARRESVLKDYEVVLYMGDNLRDFSEIFGKRGDDFGRAVVDSVQAEFGKKFIIFVNPMYGEWEKPILNYSYAHSPLQEDSLRKAALDLKK